MKKEKGLEIIKERVEDFEKNKVLIMKKGYGETNIRSNYIDIMFKALGWNIRNKFEVDREFSQKDKSKEANTKKVDYAFKLNGKLKFFIEAKEASVDLEHNKDAIYQAKRYAYSSNGKAPIVILTDFEEFRVFNVITAPDKNYPDKQLLKTHSFQYTDYIEKWDLLWNTFSKEAVENGSLDELRGTITKNTKTMDKDFLEQITRWREILAKNIAIRNEDLSVDDINEAVQRILDRLIFIRNLEDREIEPENTLLNIAKNKTDILKSLIPLFNSLNTTYNGLLFKPHFSENIIVDDKTLYYIIREMCYPVSPFQFDIIEPEILGRIYEKFLGSKIRLTDSHRAKVEEKLEVRKAGGVYYTPEYIVDYIVKTTVGKKIEGLTPNEIKDIKIVDPACGSGSFLIGAYNYLLKYHRQWYIKNKTDKDYKSDWYKSKEGEIVVNLHKRGDILQNNIFGVDIDKEATEVATMSLYLKMLDDGFDKGEKDLFFVKGAVLPNMTDNIKCGNSLVNNDYFDGKLELNDFATIKPFDWEMEFTSIFSNQGFDCVIGNPPWVFTKYVDWGVELKDYLSIKYLSDVETISVGKAKQSNKINLFAIFILKSLRILNKNGLFSFIIPNTLLRTTVYDVVRKIILDNTNIIEIVDLKSKVFEGVTASTIVLSLTQKSGSASLIKIVDNPENATSVSSEHKLVDQSTFLKNTSYAFNIFVNEEEQRTLSKIAISSNKLGVYCRDIIEGIVAHKHLVVNEQQKNTFPLLEGKTIESFYIRPFKKYLIWDTKSIHRTRPDYLWNAPKKILIRRISGGNKPLYAAIDTEKYKTFASVNNLLLKDDTELTYEFIVGLLNTNVLNFYYSRNFSNKSNLTVNISKTYLECLPLPEIDFKSKDFNEQYANVNSLVQKLQNIKYNIQQCKSDSEIELNMKQFAMLENSLNKEVYNLYKLDTEDISLIENSLK